MAAAAKSTTAAGGGKTPAGTPPPRPSRVASILPEDMVSSGLADDFVGTIRNPRFTIWNYGGTRKEYSLAVHWPIEPEDPEDPGVAQFVNKETGLFDIFYSAGNLKFFVPSMTGEEPAGATEDGYFALAEGRTSPEPGSEDEYTGIYAYATDLTMEKARRANRTPEQSKGTVWEQAMQAALDAAQAAGVDLRTEAMSGRVDVFDGVKARFNRIEKKAKVSDDKDKKGGASAGAGAQGEQRRANDVLVITEFIGREGQAAGGKAGAKASGTKAAGKPNGAPAAASAEDFASQVVEAVVAALAEHGGDEFTLLKQNLSPIVMNTFAGADKAKAVALLGKDDFRTGYPDRFTWDADAATFTLVM